ncbi:hypothetical protein JMJ58_21205 (plasmid) [Haloterrigena salifodinae]|uniref:Uncharacterized protein n=1 Tax=Haloterrigena salifodinae TaxID=2675099 RepID=A0A8T8E6I3_9EURY|nr:hypothetical protein [Haloterrigena salifodinae]QRV17474.1 hypothetical protein JMJ58_21205 [Haloterrigena salifodinae]
MTDFDLGDPAPDANEEPENERTSLSSDREATNEEDNEMNSDTEPDPAKSPKRTEPDPSETGPAFPYSEVRQSPLYAREETWTEFEDQLDLELTPNLRKEGIRDEELREIHDIVLEVALDNLEEFPERLKEKRQESQ